MSTKRKKFILTVSILILASGTILGIQLMEGKKSSTNIPVPPDKPVSIKEPTSTSMLPSDFVRWYRKQFLLSKAFDSIEMELLPQTSQYLVCNDLRSNEIKKSEFELEAETYKGRSFFQLRISSKIGRMEFFKPGPLEQANYSDRVSYYSFGFHEDIRLILDKDTLKSENFHFERNYGSSPYSVFTFDFPVEMIGMNKASIEIFDRMTTGIRTRFDIPVQNLQQLPKLKLQ